METVAIELYYKRSLPLITIIIFYHTFFRFGHSTLFAVFFLFFRVFFGVAWCIPRFYRFKISSFGTACVVWFF